jgi:hypothetical protein
MMLFTHAFDVKRGDVRRVTLKTLAALHDTFPRAPTHAHLRAVFGDSQVTLINRGFATVVTCDEQELDAAGVAAFGDSLNLRTRAQLLLSLQACVQCRWAGGYLGLRTAAMALLGPTCALWLEPLTMRMLSALLDIELNAGRVQSMLISRCTAKLSRLRASTCVQPHCTSKMPRTSTTCCRSWRLAS